MVRSQYITVSELQTLLNNTTDYPDTDETLLLINEASELIKGFCWKFAQTDDYTTTTAPDKLKLATAYQVKYAKENPDMDSIYAGNNRSVSIGKTSESVAYGGSGSQEWQKLSPKAIRYLKDTDVGEVPLITRIL
jgi:hypothetical protein